MVTLPSASKLGVLALCRVRGGRCLPLLGGLEDVLLAARRLLPRRCAHVRSVRTVRTGTARARPAGIGIAPVVDDRQLDTDLERTCS